MITKFLVFLMLCGSLFAQESASSKSLNLADTGKESTQVSMQQDSKVRTESLDAPRPASVTADEKPVADNPPSKGTQNNAANYNSQKENSPADVGSSQNPSPADRNLVVVSKTPEFFSYTLSTVAVLLTVLTIIVGIFGGIGLTIITKVYRERKELEQLRLSFDQHQETMKKDLLKEHRQMLDVMRRTAFSVSKLYRAKKEISELLSSDKPDPKRVYSSLQKTIPYPDIECIDLYADALQKCEGNLDVVRMVRNGLRQYHRNPEIGCTENNSINSFQK